MLPPIGPERFPDASRPPASLAALGPGRLVVGGEQVALPPRVLRVLLRLSVAAGEAIPAERIYRDVWNLPGAPVGRQERNAVQKCVNLLRLKAGTGESFIRTEDGGAGYRLMLPVERIDFLRFQHLVEQARSADAVTATPLIETALGLWQGSPLAEVAGLPFARDAIRRLLELRTRTEHELVALYQDIGKPERAVAFGSSCLRARPEDDVLRTMLAEIEERLGPVRRGLIHRAVGDGPPVSVSVQAGDLFEQHDAHLVVGFSDTFDTDTRDNVVISGDSLQAQVVRRLFGGDRDLLDRRLRSALRGVPAAGRERRAAKPRGRLLRYPIGTVAVLRHHDRRVFAVAYSRMGNDLIARSTMEDLRAGLDRLWPAIYREGQLRPVAMPVIGTGLARVHEASPTRLLTVIIESFVTATRARPVTAELRIVLRPADLAHIDLEETARFLDDL